MAIAGRASLNESAAAALAVEHRYPVLLATLADTYIEVLDELVLLLDQALAGADLRARTELEAN